MLSLIIIGTTEFLIYIESRFIENKYSSKIWIGIFAFCLWKILGPPTWIYLAKEN